MGFGYSWATENGPYRQFRQIQLDSSSKTNPSANVSQHLHTFSVYSESRRLFDNNDIMGARLTAGMTIENNLVGAMADFQYNTTIFYTHQRFTFYGQLGGSLGLNRKGHANPNLSLGMDACLKEWKKEKK